MQKSDVAGKPLPLNDSRRQTALDEGLALIPVAGRPGFHVGVRVPDELTPHEWYADISGSGQQSRAIDKTTGKTWLINLFAGELVDPDSLPPSMKPGAQEPSDSAICVDCGEVFNHDYAYQARQKFVTELAGYCNACRQKALPALERDAADQRAEDRLMRRRRASLERQRLDLQLKRTKLAAYLASQQASLAGLDAELAALEAQLQ